MTHHPLPHPHWVVRLECDGISRYVSHVPFSTWTDGTGLCAAIVPVRYREDAMTFETSAEAWSVARLARVSYRRCQFPYARAVKVTKK